MGFNGNEPCDDCSGGDKAAGAGGVSNLGALTVSSTEARNRLQRMRDGLDVALAVQGAASPQKSHRSIDPSEEVDAVVQLVVAEVGKKLETWREAVASEFAYVHVVIDELRFELAQVIHTQDLSKKVSLEPVVEEPTVPQPQEQSAESSAAETLSISLADVAELQKRTEAAEQEVRRVAFEKDEEITRLREQIEKITSQCLPDQMNGPVPMSARSPRPTTTPHMNNMHLYPPQPSPRAPRSSIQSQQLQPPWIVGQAPLPQSPAFHPPLQSPMSQQRIFSRDISSRSSRGALLSLQTPPLPAKPKASAKIERIDAEPAKGQLSTVYV